MAYVVANPSSGPGSSVDPSYAAAIIAARAAGITVLGYVDTNYNAVSTGTVKANIGLWHSLYNVSGIFFDRVSSLAADLSYYTTVCSYVTPGLKVLNHGAAPDQGYADLGDILAVFEGNAASWASYVPAAWFGHYPTSKLAVFIYNVATVTALTTTLTQATAIAGHVYITDEADDLFNALPGYLGEEVAALKV